MSPDILRPHVDVTSCSRCRKKLEPGDRVTQVYIFVSAGTNPLNVICRGAQIAEEYEFAHMDCNDPKLLTGNYTNKIVLP